jgi:hypothetical protein
MVFERYYRRHWLLYEWPMGKKGLKGCLYIGIKNVVWLIAGLPVPNGNRHASEISKMALRFVI